MQFSGHPSVKGSAGQGVGTYIRTWLGGDTHDTSPSSLHPTPLSPPHPSILNSLTSPPPQTHCYLLQ